MENIYYMIKKSLGIIILFLSLYFFMQPMKEQQIKTEVYKIEKAKIEEQMVPMSLEAVGQNWKRYINIGTIDNINSSFATLILENKNNIIIAGHNIDIVFHRLHFFPIGQKLNFTYQNKTKQYEIIQKLLVDPKEVQYLNETSYPQLTLITCSDDDQKRLIVICRPTVK